ncbi:MAG: DNA cytosine methyltransferase [bacterium]|nr:DNA cytosine methyltransferase [bacterium]
MKRLSTTIAAVDLFCGAGGLTHGLQRSGIDVRAGIDIDPACRYPYEKNNNTDFWERSIQDVTPEDILNAWGKAKYRVLAGCAPCQPFSTYMQGRSDSRDDRWNLLDVFGQLIVDTLPDIVTMENVPRLKEQEVFLKFIKTLSGCGFKEPTIHEVNCAEYGIPQTRRRLVLLASRHGTVELLPPPRTLKVRTVSEAIRSLPKLEAGDIDPKDNLHQTCALSSINMTRLKASKPGGTWRDWPEELRSDCHRKPSGKTYSSVYGRMSWDQPSPTITTQFFGFGNGRFGHPEQDRALSFREGAILQSFPRHYKFVAPSQRLNKTTIGRMIGNAVPVKLGEVIGKSIVHHLGQLANGQHHRR